MAVTQSSDDNLESPVEGIKPSCREVADPGPCVLPHLNKPDGILSFCSDKVTSTGQPDISKDNSGFIKRCKLRRYRTENNASDNLSDIDDAEVIGYLNTKMEMSYKRILWEAMNGKFVTVFTHSSFLHCYYSLSLLSSIDDKFQAKKQKRGPEKKKGVPLKKTTRTTEKVELRRPSSRINYDALKSLYNELEQGSEVLQIVSADSYTHRNKVSPNENIKPKVRGSNENYHNNFQPEISYSKDNETSDCHYDLCDEYGDEHFNGDYFDFE